MPFEEGKGGAKMDDDDEEASQNTQRRICHFCSFCLSQQFGCVCFKSASLGYDDYFCCVCIFKRLSSSTDFCPVLEVRAFSVLAPWLWHSLPTVAQLASNWFSLRRMYTIESFKWASYPPDLSCVFKQSLFFNLIGIVVAVVVIGIAVLLMLFL